MKTLIISIFFLAIIKCNAQHVYRSAMNLKIIDSTENVVSESEFSNGNYQLYIQKGNGSLYQETNIDSVGVIHIYRNGVMPSDVGLSWNIILINNNDTMFIQYQNTHISSDIPIEIPMVNGDYLYDLIRTTNSNLELGWKLIEMDKIKSNQVQEEWIDFQLIFKTECIKKITEGEYRKSITTYKQH
jgi:hypothetical protein